MFRGMFPKLFFTYLTILVLSMLVLSLAMSYIAESYVFSEKKKTLDDVYSRANTAANSYLSGEITQHELSGIINAMGYISDAKIYVIQGDITPTIDTGGELTGEYLKDALEQALAGEEVFIKRQYSSGFEANMLFAAYPWRDSSGINGAILLFSPEDEVASITGNIRLVIWLTAAAFALLGAFIIYLFSRKIVRPIKAIDAASGKMAGGEYPEDLVINSNDELASMARSFNSMKRKLADNERLRQDLIANISHDLRTPITNINGFLSGMADGLIRQEDYPKYLAILKKETRRLIDLTGGILEAAKVKSGSIELNPENFRLYEAVKEAADANLTAVENKGICIDYNIAEDLYVYADYKKTVQVLYNLINNAVKYSGSGVVSVSAQRSGDVIEVCVKDDGPGIPESSLAHIFDRYYRAEGNDTPGYGLGLAIAKSYIEAHGGHIWIQSTSGKGTRVYFTLSESAA